MKQVTPGLWDFDEISDSVHCYLWEWSGGVTLIDAGYPHDGEAILDALRKNGYPLHSVQRVIVTHVDLDHTGGLAIVRRATQAPIACHAVEREFLEQPHRRQPKALYLRPLYWIITNFVEGYRLQPLTPDELMVDGQVLPEGFTVIHTPGHTPGHISLLHKEKRFLITGDALSNRGGKLRTPISLYTPDEYNAQRSIWRLAKKYSKDIDVIAFGHGPPILKNGGKRINGLTSQVFSQNV
ncbi:MBL fold metallo-hydrolase [Chloroflexi bacterium TSY]|nr:MBL fold metallo-hydrolase [Chloroflexi bacterium TSY]